MLLKFSPWSRSFLITWKFLTNAESQSPPKTYWIKSRTCILIRSTGYSCAQCVWKALSKHKLWCGCPSIKCTLHFLIRNNLTVINPLYPIFEAKQLSGIVCLKPRGFLFNHFYTHGFFLIMDKSVACHLVLGLTLTLLSILVNVHTLSKVWRENSALRKWISFLAFHLIYSKLLPLLFFTSIALPGEEGGGGGNALIRRSGSLWGKRQHFLKTQSQKENMSFNQPLVPSKRCARSNKGDSEAPASGSQVVLLLDWDREETSWPRAIIWHRGNALWCPFWWQGLYFIP